MHVFQAFMEFLRVPHEAVPILMLPQRSPTTAPRVQAQRHDLLGVVQHLPKCNKGYGGSISACQWSGIKT